MTASTKRALFLSLALAAGFVPGTDAPSQALGREGTRAPRAFPHVQEFADAVVRDGRVPGIAIAVGLDGGPTTYISAGHLTTDPASAKVGPDSLWRIYSMTKPVTALAAMILVDEGRLRLGEPVGNVIREFRSSRVLLDPTNSLASRPASRPITVRDLLTHTSGLNYSIGGRGPATDELRAKGIVPFALNRSVEAEIRPRRPGSLQEFARRAAGVGLIADPGTKFSYSMGLDVLAAVVERVSGIPFETFVQRRILDPLHMRSTYWQVPRREAGRLVTDYGPEAVEAAFGKTPKGNAPFVALDSGSGSVYLDPPSFPYGGAGLVSTARDYDRFLHMLQNGGSLGRARILGARTARLAKSNLFPAGVTLRNFGPIPPGEPTGFGAGGFVTTVAVDAFGRHRGTYGWDGAAGSRAWVDGARNLRATMMINRMGAPNVGADFDRAVAADVQALASPASAGEQVVPSRH